jgi:predicted CXXCH cytochrome family protein
VWERARQSPDCLTCHNPLAETTHATGVGCGACHHTIDTTRRQAEGSSTTYHGQMGTLASAADCGTCHGADHALTYVEWEASAHNGARTVDCLSCHQSHTGGLTAASGRELCGSCHLQDVPTTNPHMHVDSGCTDCHPAPVSTDNVHMSGLETDVECVACHVVTELDHYGRYLARAGHLMDVPLVACTNCHGSLHDLLSQP